ARFVFVGAGGGSLPLLQKARIPEIRGYGGFPVGGQWLVCDNPDVVSQHQAKVYGQAQDEAPTMAVPHLDTRVIDGKKWLLFGPFAAWTTKFLHNGGRWTDLPSSVKFGNLGTLLKVGMKNFPLVRYLIKEGTQSKASRLNLLRSFYPGAREEDWKLKDAGIRVQAIKKEDGQAGIVHFGTEVLVSADRSICALLGASPGASVCVSIILEVIEKCMPHLLAEGPGKAAIERFVPTYRKNFTKDNAAECFAKISQTADRLLQLTV
ncbi:MAG: malate:quinone oxidoreductase, partial [Pirellulales bacterium]|nr:malate:quinone oxidoreductase [Pirellulales bacterium]